MAKTSKDTLRARVRKKQKAFNWNDSETARQAGLSRQAFWYAMNIGTRPSYTTLAALARAFKCPVEELAGSHSVKCF